MNILPVNSNQNINFSAALKVTQQAKRSVYQYGSRDTIVSDLVFSRAMEKFRDRLYGQYPFAGDVFFDTISKKTKELKPNTISNYEMRLHDKVVDYHFDFNRVHNNHSNQSIEEKINQEAVAQSNFLYDTYLYLKKLCNK